MKTVVSQATSDLADGVFHVTVQRIDSMQVLSGFLPKPEDVPEDVKQALRVWLAGNGNYA